MPAIGIVSSRSSRTTLIILLPLILLFATLFLLAALFLIAYLILRRRKRRIALADLDGPLDLSRQEDDEGLAGWGIGEAGGQQVAMARWAETLDEGRRAGWERAKDFQLQHPPNSQPTGITLSQFLTIQEKGVSAWSFEPDYESAPPLFVQSRTEITFLADGEGMAPREGGACSVQSNLPLPRLNECYYWEVKLFELSEGTEVAIGLATRPYPSFRLPGWNKYSVAYSSTGETYHNHPFTGHPSGPPLHEGDVLGVGYRPRTGTVFFTRNGKRLDPPDTFTGLTRHDLFPTVGTTGAAVLHVNLGQAGFVFIEANVKKWGLAPMIGTLAPPPAYGSEGGSVLLERGLAGAREGQAGQAAQEGSASPRRNSQRARRPPPNSTPDSVVGSPHPHRPSPLRSTTPASSPAPAAAGPSHSRTASNTIVIPSVSASCTPTPPSHTPTPAPRPSSPAPSDSLASSPRQAPNPPTPNLLDISLRNLSSSSSLAQTIATQRALDQTLPPPGYAPVDPQRYPHGVPLGDVDPAEIMRMLGESDTAGQPRR